MNITKEHCLTYIGLVEQLCIPKIIVEYIDFGVDRVSPMSPKIEDALGLTTLAKAMMPNYFANSVFSRLEEYEGFMALQESPNGYCLDMDAAIANLMSIEHIPLGLHQDIYEDNLTDEFIRQKLDLAAIIKKLQASAFIKKAKRVLRTDFDQCADWYLKAKYKSWCEVKAHFKDNRSLEDEYMFAKYLFYYGIAIALLHHLSSCAGELGIVGAQHSNNLNILKLASNIVSQDQYVADSYFEDIKQENEVYASWDGLFNRENADVMLPDTVLRMIHALHTEAKIGKTATVNIIWKLSSLFGAHAKYSDGAVKYWIEKYLIWYGTDSTRIYTGRMTHAQEKQEQEHMEEMKHYETPYSGYWDWHLRD